MAFKWPLSDSSGALYSVFATPVVKSTTTGYCIPNAIANANYSNAVFFYSPIRSISGYQVVGLDNGMLISRNHNGNFSSVEKRSSFPYVPLIEFPYTIYWKGVSSSFSVHRFATLNASIVQDTTYNVPSIVIPKSSVTKSHINVHWWCAVDCGTAQKWGSVICIDSKTNSFHNSVVGEKYGISIGNGTSASLKDNTMFSYDSFSVPKPTNSYLVITLPLINAQSEITPVNHGCGILIDTEDGYYYSLLY